MDDENLSCELSIDNVVSIGDSTFLNDSSLSGHLDRIASALLTDRQHGEQARERCVIVVINAVNANHRVTCHQ